MAIWFFIHDDSCCYLMIYCFEVSGLMLSTHGTEDISIPSIDLYSSADKETDMCATAVEGEEIFNVLDEDVHLELDADQINQAVERSSFLSLDSWGGLWFLPSFINHSCLPNACWMKIGEDALFARAARHLRKGDEVTVSYLGGETVAFPHRAYAARLRGFRCSCPRCLFEASEKFIENLGDREWVTMTTMCNISNAVKFYQLLESSVKLIEKLEWGFKNVASLWNDEGKQEWLRCSFAQAYKTCLAFRAFHGQAFAQDLEILIRAVHATIGASEEFLDFLSPFMWVHPQLEAAIAPMCLCLYGEQSSASLREILGVEMEN
ncbi:hypothetical protein KP509_14G081400 [Ceratopteris richardii]|uniref:SET domain-containing protein n=1 Tax=Ceratopteris richardii TaxID=49495 RepID=A0A8T2TER1_CERRI|nr:hypothetical protein KP509_14G081400 [Ceratopteris richardii]KAH7416224.1 hypothetical protein KP509_14G081400 [Ceratopteris richardii]